MWSDLTGDGGRVRLMVSGRWWADYEGWGREGCWPIAGTQSAGAPSGSPGPLSCGRSYASTWAPPTWSLWVEVAEGWSELSWEDLGHFRGLMMGLRAVGGTPFTLHPCKGLTAGLRSWEDFSTPKFY